MYHQIKFLICLVYFKDNTWLNEITLWITDNSKIHYITRYLNTEYLFTITNHSIHICKCILLSYANHAAHIMKWTNYQMMWVYHDKCFMKMVKNRKWIPVCNRLFWYCQYTYIKDLPQTRCLRFIQKLKKLKVKLTNNGNRLDSGHSTIILVRNYFAVSTLTYDMRKKYHDKIFF